MEALNNTYEFKIGQFNCLAVSDGIFAKPDNPSEYTPNQDTVPPDPGIQVTCLFIKTREHAILIDTGCGTWGQPGAGRLVQNLQTAGIQCTEIDMVILSHAHPDHIGGNTDAKGKPAFPNARYIISKQENEFWMSNPELAQINDEGMRKTLMNNVRNNLIPIQSNIEEIDDDIEVVPGIKLIKAPGHTPGHMMQVISSGSEQLFCTADLIQFLVQLEQPELCIDVELAPEKIEDMRVKILYQLAEAQTLVFAGHFPFPGLGRIAKKGDTYSWNPI